MSTLREAPTRSRLPQLPLLPLAVANLVANIGIVVTGGAVRLTSSGLGCPTWPRCTADSYRPHGELEFHSAIEFGNRLLTFVLVAIAVATWVAALQRVLADRTGADRRPLTLATVVALGVPFQAVIGGVTVLTDLNPWVVALHLLLSMAMIGVCVVLVDHVRGGARPGAAAGVRRLAWAVFASGWLVLYLGTVVTGSGPHSGDENARRTGLDPQVMSHVHAASVYLLLALTVALLLATRRTSTAGGSAARAVTVLLVIELAQGVIGFVQYFTDLPELLVGTHLLGAALTSAALTWVVLATRSRD
ncbi:COX15/CtaA family protein [Nocardioides panacisoli]|uniref:COX15/CtaA family protein n=1 Tax=Nocardioides panacisoli TaxID=627624 RepID=UPI001C6334D2|nr:COX15/CtaA family protein [Nocardioides panacisoli]QYJ04977.1 COX15/CtaA family protein [Nocardioides panacisoli]